MTAETMRQMRLLLILTLCSLVGGCGATIDLPGLGSDDAEIHHDQATGCVLIGLETSGVSPTPRRRVMSLAAAAAEVEKYEPPEGLDSERLLALKQMVTSALRGTGTAKFTSAPPTGVANVIKDLVLVGSDSDGWQLQWTYTNCGDYDQNGEVGVSDLTPVGRCFLATPFGDQWGAAQLADGDANYEVNVADITSIGQNFLAQVTCYNVYGADAMDGPWAAVTSGQVPAMPNDRVVQLFVGLPTRDFEFYRVVPADSSGAEGEPSWASMAGGEPAEFDPGEDVIELTATVETVGATLEGPEGTELEGVSVYIPPSAVDGPSEFSLGCNQGEIVLGGRSIAGPIFSLSSSEFDVFDDYLEITMPYSGGPEALPVPFIIDHDGELDPLLLIGLDRQAGMVTFASDVTGRFFCMSSGSMKQGSDVPDTSLPSSYFTGFGPSSDGFQISNFNTKWVNGGACAGMGTFASWYFINHAKQQGILFPRFMARADGVPAQQIIASRAHISVIRSWDHMRKLCDRLNAGLDAAEVFEAIQRGIATKGKPVQILAWGNTKSGEPAGHLMVGTGYLGDRIMLYDCNSPGIATWLKLDRSKGVIEPYGFFKQFDFGGSHYFYKEPFSNILADANETPPFGGSRRAQIEVTSHTDGQQVAERTIELAGKVQSGDVLVESLRVSVSAPFRTRTFWAAVTPTGSFSQAVELEPGPCSITFQPYGHDAESKWLELPSNYQTTPGFTLDCAAEEYALLVELSWNYGQQQWAMYWIRNTESLDYCCYHMDYQYLDTGEWWRNPIVDPMGFGPEYFGMPYSQYVPWGNEYEIWVTCLQIHPFPKRLDWTLVITQNEGSSAEQRRVLSGTLTDYGVPWGEVFRETDTMTLAATVKLTQP